MTFKNLGTVISGTLSAVILAFLAAAVLWVSNDTYESVLENQTKAMSNMAESTMSAIEQYTSTAKKMVRTLAMQPVMRAALAGSPDEADAVFKKLLALHSDCWAGFLFDARGQVVAGYNAKGTNMRGADRSGRGYVQRILGGTGELLSPDILVSKSGGGIQIFAVAAAVKDETGKTVGGIGIFPKWNTFTESFIDPYRIGENGYGFMVDAKGRFIAHAMDKNLVMTDASQYDFIRIALGRKKGTFAYSWNGKEKLMAVRTHPETGWMVAMSAYEGDLASGAVRQRTILAVGGTVAALLLCTILILTLRSLVLKPVEHLLHFATRVAEGDLKRELHGTYRFELARLASAIQTMVSELKTRLGFADGVLRGMPFPSGIVGPDGTMLWANRQICDMLEKGKEPEAYVGEKAGAFYWDDASRSTLAEKSVRENIALDEEVRHTSRSGQERDLRVTVTPFHDMDDTLLGSLAVWIDLTDIRAQQRVIEQQNQRIAVAAEKAEDIAQHLSAASEELAAQIEESSQGAGFQQERAAETATAMEQMNSTVLEVAQNASFATETAGNARSTAQEGAGIVGEVVTAISEVQAKAVELRASMEGLGKQAESIGHVMGVINDIADQTNLLALNAAIEAARAGEAGRGFAVVADEVRKLAEKTMDATREVGNAIDGIQAAAAANVQATESAVDSVARSTELATRSGRTLEAIVELVDSVDDQVRGIATAAEQQSATSEQINRATEEINRVAAESADSMSQSSAAVQEIATMASTLNTTINDMTAR